MLARFSQYLVSRSKLFLFVAPLIALTLSILIFLPFLPRWEIIFIIVISLSAAMFILCAGLHIYESRRIDATLKALISSININIVVTDGKGTMMFSNISQNICSSPSSLHEIVSRYSSDTSLLIKAMLKEVTLKLKTQRCFNNDTITLIRISPNRLFWILDIDKSKGPDRDAKHLIIKNSNFNAPYIDFESLPISILVLDQNGRMVSANHAARLLLGSSFSAGISFAEVFSGLGRSVQDWLQEVITNKAKSASEVLCFENADGEHFIHIHISPLLKSGKPYIVAVMTDGSSYKKIETQFNQSQKMQAIGQLAGGISHDFNNLLTAISGHCDLLLMNKAHNDPDYQDLINIAQNTNRAAALVSQLLAFSRKQPLRAEVFDVSDTIADLSHLLHRLIGDNYDLDLQVSNDRLIVNADRRRIEQVVVNLVINARDAMPKGGKIRITLDLKVMQQPENMADFQIPAGRYIRLTVSDNGVGIKPEHHGKIFDPFYTTKPVGSGTGLGLSTVYGIVKQAGGYIFFRSDEGEGSDFTILIPQSNLRTNSKEPSNPVPDFQNNTLKSILLLDDEKSIRELLSRSLINAGHRVYDFESVDDANRFLHRSSHMINVIITDIIMPESNGVDWIKHVKISHPEMKVIFISGYADENILEEARKIENATFVSKPFTLAELHQTLQS